MRTRIHHRHYLKWLRSIYEYPYPGKGKDCSYSIIVKGKPGFTCDYENGQIKVSYLALDERRLSIVPIFQRMAFAYIEAHHRHHKKPAGSVFQLAVSDGKKIVGVAIAGRPNGRIQQDGITLEIIRVCTDGTPNVCSMLYSACWRTAKGLGYKKLITYILDTESGTSLKAAGWTLLGRRGGGSWSRPSRQRNDSHPLQKKLLFEIK